MGFIVVAGLPGSGKTTVGRALAGVLQRPFLDKDDFLEQLLEASSSPPAERSVLSRRADAEFIEQARTEPTAVLVSFWRRLELSTTSGTATEWLAGSESAVELWCRCPPAVALGRFIGRRRHPGHGDQARDEAELRHQFESLSRLGSLGVGRLVSVDTAVDVDITELRTVVCDPEHDER